MANGGTPGFSRLPIEILQNVAYYVSERVDLVSLSLASKATHEVFRACLWRSLTFELSEGATKSGEFPSFSSDDPPLHYTRELNFSVNSSIRMHRRCPHWNNHGNSHHRHSYWYSHCDLVKEGDLHFKSLAEGAKAVLLKIGDGELRSLSWDLETCLPFKIFGPGSVIAEKQSRIESLSIITDPNCFEFIGNYSLELLATCSLTGLASLTNLKRLRWIKPGRGDIYGLDILLQKNAEHLKHLEIDFLCGDRFTYWQENPPPSLGVLIRTEESLQWARIEEMPESKFSGPYFPALETLCLTEAHLNMDSATALDFETLQTLKLRDCRGWNHLLERIMQLRRPVGLKVLEICESPSLRTCEVDTDLRHADLIGVVSEFLATFVGLEGLYVSIEGPADMDRLWSGVISHRATLKRFVHYQGIEDEPDVMTLGYDEPGEISLMSLDEFQLEAIGLTLLPEYLIHFLSPLKSNKSLKLLHIRQSNVDVQRMDGIEFVETLRPRSRRKLSDTDGENADEEDTDQVDTDTEALPEEIDTEQPVKLERLNIHLKKLVDWAFGPDGIASLQFIACGDWSHGGGRKSQGWQVHDRDVIICRSESETGNGHRVLRRDNSTANEEFEKIVGAHRELLEACPSEQFLPRLWAGFY